MTLAVVLARVGLALAPTLAAPLQSAAPLAWDARRAEHLFERAGFGLRPAELEAFVARGPEAAVDWLLAERPLPEPFFRRRTLPSHLRADKPETRDEEQALRREFYRRDREQLRCYAGHWMRGMVDGLDPLRDRMTLFWVGFFTTHYLAVGRPSELVLRQHQFLRDGALASYAELLHGVVDQSALRRYLDGDTSVREHPNENLARELMELFSLGEGNYTERDVREAARALTGYGVGLAPDEAPLFDAAAHDGGEKVILGERAAFDAHSLVELLLRQEACARWVARRLIGYLEGQPPEAARERAYAELLRAEGYELRPFLRALLLEPAFYREEVLGRRVQAPVDFVVGSARRLGLAPAPLFLADAAGLLGHRFWDPPSVKGWDEGAAWITTASLIDRGNVAGMLLGVVDAELLGARYGDARREVGAGDDAAAMQAQMEMAMQMAAPPGEERELEGAPVGYRGLLEALGPLYRPTVNLVWRVERAGARTDVEVARLLLAEALAIAPPPETLRAVAARIAAERARFGIAEGELPAHRDDAEELLRGVLHVVLCLPEAQLH